MNGWLPPALWRLVGLRVRAAGRDAAERLRTPSGALAGLATLAFLGGWLVPVFLLPGQLRPVSPAFLEQVGPFGLLLVWVGQVIIRGGGEVLGFQPAEADQLFAIPAAPEALLRYKVTLLLVAWTTGAVMLSPMAMFYAAHPLGGFLAVLLLLPFLQLSAMISAMVRQGGRRRPVARLLFLGVLAALAIAAVRTAPEQGGGWLGTLAAHPVSGALMTPFAAGIRLLTAGEPLRLLGAASVVLVLDVVLVGVLLRLGRGAWLEIAADGAQHVQDTMQRYRREGGVGAVGGWVGVRVPLFPRLGGVGTVAWRRVAEIVRRPATFATFGGVIALVVAVGVILPLVIPRAPRTEVARAMLVATLVWGNMLAPSLLRLDFRADLDRMDPLLGLPVRPAALLLGQVLPMAALISATSLVLFVGIAVWCPPAAGTALGMALAQPAFALVVLMVENALFLWFPVRTEAGEAALQSVGRNLILSLVGWAVHGLAAGAALGTALAVWFVSGSLLGGALAASVPLLSVAAIFLGVGAYRLRRFDPSVHVPH